MTRAGRRAGQQEEQTQDVEKSVAHVESLSLGDDDDHHEHDCAGDEKALEQGNGKQKSAASLATQTSSASSTISASVFSYACSIPSTVFSAESASTFRSNVPSKSRARSQSPVKTVSDLRLLDKEIEFKGKIILEDLPDCVHELWDQMEDCSALQAVVPGQIRNEFQAQCSRSKPWWFTETQDARSKFHVLVELEKLKEILEKTEDYKNCPRNERAWNGSVHTPMLHAALQTIPGIKAENITTVRPDTRWLANKDLDPAGKMVDFAIVVDDSLIPTSSVRQKLANEAAATGAGIKPFASINHTIDSYAPLQLAPIAVNIETKTSDGKSSDAKVQLSLWAAAQLNRLRTLLQSTTPRKTERSSSSSSTAQPVVTMPLPLIMTVGGRYYLFFAIDHTDRVEIVGEVKSFGSTEDLQGCYSVLTGLRRIAEWVVAVWVPWFNENCLQ